MRKLVLPIVLAYVVGALILIYLTAWGLPPGYGNTTLVIEVMAFGGSLPLVVMGVRRIEDPSIPILHQKYRTKYTVFNGTRVSEEVPVGLPTKTYWSRIRASVSCGIGVALFVGGVLGGLAIDRSSPPGKAYFRELEVQLERWIEVRRPTLGACLATVWTEGKVACDVVFRAHTTADAVAFEMTGIACAHPGVETCVRHGLLTGTLRVSDDQRRTLAIAGATRVRFPYTVAFAGTATAPILEK
ncbi:MAG: hypothetical protein NT062_21765 [Proteobacteria bacterium]|nr:hypothetical protein [Pseudomonadota bacterium]